jgi:hypothetical protein
MDQPLPCPWACLPAGFSKHAETCGIAEDLAGTMASMQRDIEVADAHRESFHGAQLRYHYGDVLLGLGLAGKRMARGGGGVGGGSQDVADDAQSLLY